VQELVASTYDQLLATRAAIRSFRDEVRANQVALDGVEQEALVGSRTVLDVLDAEQELFQSQVDLVRARRDEVITSYQLKAAVGQLTVADLGLGVETYDPKAYYERNRTRLFGLDGGALAAGAAGAAGGAGGAAASGAAPAAAGAAARAGRPPARWRPTPRGRPPRPAPRRPPRRPAPPARRAGPPPLLDSRKARRGPSRRSSITTGPVVSGLILMGRRPSRSGRGE
jgi:hypothetical protein